MPQSIATVYDFWIGPALFHKVLIGPPSYVCRDRVHTLHLKMRYIAVVVSLTGHDAKAREISSIYI